MNELKKEIEKLREYVDACSLVTSDDHPSISSAFNHVSFELLKLLNLSEVYKDER
jgi:hypothetical protein